MPLTKSGEKVLSDMIKTYGSAKKGKQVFYSSINAGKKGSEGWHLSEALKKRKGKK